MVGRVSFSALGSGFGFFDFARVGFRVFWIFPASNDFSKSSEAGILVQLITKSSFQNPKIPVSSTQNPSLVGFGRKNWAHAINVSLIHQLF